MVRPRRTTHPATGDWHSNGRHRSLDHIDFVITRHEARGDQSILSQLNDEFITVGERQ